MQFQRLQRLIDKYLNGRSSPQENLLVERWLDTIASQKKDEIEEDKKQAIRNRILYKVKTRTQIQPTKKRNLYLRSWLKVAAAVIPLCLTLLYTTHIFTPNTLLTATTRIGEHREVLLPDGSKVWLRPNSSLTYPEAFSDLRTVTLTGEAFFDVKRNPEKKFIVATEDVQVEVLGTSFDVKAYRQLPNVSVTVNTGKVKVMDDEQLLGTLLPHDRLIYTIESSKVSIARASLIDPEGDEAFVFEDITLYEVLKTLESYYPVQFLGELPEAVRLSGSFRRDMTVAQLVDVLNTVIEKHHIRIEKQNEAIYRVK